MINNHMDLIPSIAHRLTISVTEFCQLSGIGRTKAWALIREGKLDVTRVGRRTLVSLESARKLIVPQSRLRNTVSSGSQSQTEEQG